MSTVRERAQGAKNFFGDVVAEVKKATWPPRGELVESTIVVIVSLVLLSFFVGASDFVLDRLLGFILKVL